MIYLGKYYEDNGYKTGMLIPRLADVDSSIYTIVAINNVDKKSMTWDASIDEETSSPFYYSFKNLDVSSLSEGEYTLSMYVDEAQLFSGLMSYREKKPVDGSVYDSSRSYIVYGQN